MDGIIAIRGRARHANGGKHFINQRPLDPDKWFTLFVLVPIWGFANHHHARLLWAIAEHEISRTLFQGTQIKHTHRIAQCP